MKKIKLTKSEHQECQPLVDYLAVLKKMGRILNYTHISNETYTPHWSVLTKNKQAGLRKGIPDYAIISKRKLFFIEMKTKIGKLSKEQVEWIDNLNKVNVPAMVCYGFDEAKKFVDINL